VSRFSHLATVHVEILRISSTNLGRGKWQDGYVSSTPSVGARIAPAGATEMKRAEQMQVRATHVLYTEPDAAVRVLDDVLELDGPLAGRRFRVTGLLPPSVPHHLKALLEEVQRPAEA
jgi:hypothetical protein